MYITSIKMMTIMKNNWLHEVQKYGLKSLFDTNTPNDIGAYSKFYFRSTFYSA